MILIVDDNQENIFSLKSLLTLHHFEVDAASSGEEALKKILREEIELRREAEVVLEKKVEERTLELKRTNERLEQSDKELQQFALHCLS